ncbi:MAG: DUF3306 domain-containing protein [Gammaproteobacteria bacterium]|nr:DUF3306 domain-containing protein [Gammaproteobacteria bacterium]MCY4228323.1 DUF3306 domain-containing protein [Gammaproteobacteria bacterium]
MSKKQTTESDQEAFLSRWSRLKAEHAEQASEKELAKTEATGQPDSEDSTESDEETRVLTDEDMPPIESLDANSDYSVFMSKGVSENLRRMALRKLFSQGVFNIRDGLDDYDDDFTTFESLGDLVTSDMKHREEMKEKVKQRELDERKREAAGDDGSASDAAESEVVTDTVDENEPEADTTDDQTDPDNSRDDNPHP